MGRKQTLEQIESRDLFVVRTVTRQLAFEEDEAVDGEGFGMKVAVAPEEGVDGLGVAAVLSR